MKKIVLSILILFSVCPLLFSQNTKIQAMFVYNFTKYLTWEGDESETFNIGVYKNKDFFNEIELLAANFKVADKQVTVKEFSNIENIASCHILYTSEQSLPELKKIWEQISTLPILLVTSDADTDFRGININFIVKDKRQKFELYPPNLRDRKIKIDKELLNKAIVKKF